MAGETKCKIPFDRTLSYTFFLVARFANGGEMLGEVKLDMPL
jgi:hypothetical protein